MAMLRILTTPVGSASRLLWQRHVSWRATLYSRGLAFIPGYTYLSRQYTRALQAYAGFWGYLEHPDNWMRLYLYYIIAVFVRIALGFTLIAAVLPDQDKQALFDELKRYWTRLLPLLYWALLKRFQQSSIPILTHMFASQFCRRVFDYVSASTLAILMNTTNDICRSAY